MNLIRRITRLETSSLRRRDRGKPSFRSWLAEQEGVPVNSLDPRIQSLADLAAGDLDSSKNNDTKEVNRDI